LFVEIVDNSNKEMEDGNKTLFDRIVALQKDINDLGSPKDLHGRIVGLENGVDEHHTTLEVSKKALGEAKSALKTA
jgi:hypothetical protein